MINENNKPVGYELSATPTKVTPAAEAQFFKEGKGFREFAKNNIPYLKDVVDGMISAQDFQQNVISHLAMDVAKKEDALLMEVLEKHLGRKPTMEDAKDCQMVRTPEMPHDSYIFCHKGTQLGYLEKSGIERLYDEPLYLNQFKVGIKMSFKPLPLNYSNYF